MDQNIALLDTLRRAQQLARDALREMDDATTTQAVILSAIGANPGASQTAIVNATMVDRSTLADVVHRLVKMGLVKQATDPEDRRAKRLTLTTLGQKALVSAEVSAKQAVKELGRIGLQQGLLRELQAAVDNSGRRLEAAE